MKAGKYSIKELFTNRHINQIIIPEIQRDYVWSSEQVIGLLGSITEAYLELVEARKNPIVISVSNSIKHDSLVIQEDFRIFHNQRKYASNIGFIYAYNDPEYQGKYFLVDGQQRITTIYLLLLALASRSNKSKEEFKKIYLIEGQLKLDYKVREAAHEFINKFIPFALNSLEDVTNQNWFYNDYNSDKTIKNLVANYLAIQSYLSEKIANEIDFFDYVQNYIEFWYFDTNVSEQGEELYLYMNARGEQMQGNENIKADLLGKLSNETIPEGKNLTDLKNQWGKEWEEWQDFFWQNKGIKNKNADVGFNEFLACIAGLQNYLSGNKDYFHSNDKFSKHDKIHVKDILSVLDLLIIKKYIKGLKLLKTHAEVFKSNYKYSLWIKDSFNDFWKILNEEKTNWYANYSDKNRGTERNRMIFLWSILYYLSKLDSDSVNSNEVFRMFRMYYLRYHNYNRSVSTIKKTVDTILINGIWDTIDNSIERELDINGNLIELNIEEETDKKLRTKEEIYKFNLLKPYGINEQRLLEETIWEIEDHKYNLDGKGVGQTNFIHLIDINDQIDSQKLLIVKDTFHIIFPPKTSSLKQNHLTIQNILLYYGKYWEQVTPQYYENYKFDNWYKIVRGYINKNTSNDYFSTFFNDFIEFKGSLEDFLFMKRQALISIAKASDSKDIFLWYNQHLGDKMWSQGNNLAIRSWIPKDKAFPQISEIYNTKGNFKGGSPTELYKLLPHSIKQKLQPHDEQN